jgi:hypothetical protein
VPCADGGGVTFLSSEQVVGFEEYGKYQVLEACISKGWLPVDI